MPITMELLSWTAFAVLTVQLLLAVALGRVTCPEHAVSRLAWPISAAALATSRVWDIHWALIVGGAIAVLGVLHISWMHSKAMRSRLRDGAS
jgi:hypothetical protein